MTKPQVGNLKSSEPQSGTVLIHLPGDVSVQRARQAGSSSSGKSCLLVASLFLFSLGFLILSALFGYWVYVHITYAYNGTGIPSDTVGDRHNTFNGKTAFGLEDLFNSSLRPRTPGVTWAADRDVAIYRSSNGDLLSHNVETGEKKVLIDNATFVSLKPYMHFVSGSMNYVLVLYEYTTLSEGIPIGRAKIYDVQKKTIIRFPNDATIQHQDLQFVSWAGSGEALTFVYKNNLYYQSSPSAKPAQLTTSGKTLVIKNGLLNWDYRGILSDFGAHWISKDSSYIVYAELNFTRNEIMNFPYYGNGSSKYTYPDPIRFTYAKSGTGKFFTDAKLYVLNLKDLTKPKVLIEPPAKLKNKDHYIQNVVWRDSNHALVFWVNRAQNETIDVLCDIPKATCQPHSEYQMTNGWIEIHRRAPYMIEEGKQYLQVVPRAEGQLGNWKNLALVDAPLGGKAVKIFLTTGTREVVYIAAYDPKLKVAYYVANGDHPLKKHLYRVGTPAADEIHRPVKCLTCDRPAGCQHVFVNFSPSAKYYFLTCLGPDIPTVEYINAMNGSVVIIEDNSAVRAKLAQKAMPTVEYHDDIDIGGGYKGVAQFILPPNLDPNKKYPVVFYPYAGPHGHQQASYRYTIGLETYHASSEGMITVRLDGRGSGGRGDKFLMTLYRRLGTDEIQDQILGAKSIREKFKYVDASKIGIYGGSYGGFTASHVIGDKSDVIKCGIAVCPVISFRYYYIGYTERYMGLDTKEDNQAGYDLTDATLKVNNFKNKTFLLIHGTADDNVHYQNAAMLNKALVEADVDFEERTYIDRRHALSGGNTLRHRYRLMTRFFKKSCFGL